MNSYEDKLESRIVSAMEEAERKAIDSLARYKFQMFGYWAAAWVGLNRLARSKKPNPFRNLVAAARVVKVTMGEK